MFCFGLAIRTSLRYHTNIRMQAFLEVSLILALATGMAILMQSLRLPLLLGHILTGILVGPAVWHILQAKETVEIFSQLGITALLFVVGLGLHPQVIREVGKIALLTGIGQVVFTTGFGFILALLFGFSWISALCIAIALTFSSTIIVTKILSDRGDSGKLYGKISIGFLLVQDVIATLILILVGSIGGAQDVRSLVVVVGIKLLIVAATMLVTAQFILPRLTRLFAASQEFLFLFSIGWGVGLAAIFYAIGLSVEIGALAAGVTLASSPYRYEINAKMRLVRDFFIVMFFVLLGSRLSWEGLGAQWPVILLFSFFVLIGNPIIIMGIMGFMRYSKKTSFLAGLTVAQVSEFSLILMLLFADRGYVPASVLSLVTSVCMITMTVSTFMLLHSEKIYAAASRYLGIFERRHLVVERAAEQQVDAILFGCHRVGTDFIATLQKRGSSYLVVDFDPSVIEQLESKQIPCRYGDAHDNEFLEEVGVAKASLIISTIPDFEVNLFILKKTQKMNKKGLIILTAQSVEQARLLYAAGAAYVIMPHYLGGNHAAMLLERHGYNEKKIALERKHHLEHLEERIGES